MRSILAIRGNDFPAWRRSSLRRHVDRCGVANRIRNFVDLLRERCRIFGSGIQTIDDHSSDLHNMDFDEYESLPTSNVRTHMVAGALAGIMEHCVMYPLDSVKTRMQSLTPNPLATYKTIPEALYKMVRYEGLLRPVRGMAAVVGGAGPAHALYFSCYEKVKAMLVGSRPGHHPLAHGVAGCLATLLHDGIMSPADVIKQRMQVYGSPYRSCWDCIRTVYRSEGSTAFYRSYTTQLTMNVPFQCIHFITYEFMQDILNAERRYDPKVHMIAGAVAGAMASAITTPLDVCKTLLNTQESQALHLTNRTRVTGLVDAVQLIYKCVGVRGYFQGIQARILFQIPSTAIAWSVYEFFKYFLTKRQQVASRQQAAPIEDEVEGNHPWYVATTNLVIPRPMKEDHGT